MEQQEKCLDKRHCKAYQEPYSIQGRTDDHSRRHIGGIKKMKDERLECRLKALVRSLPKPVDPRYNNCIQCNGYNDDKYCYVKPRLIWLRGPDES